jgi:uncharacterized integral membrane protein
VTTPPEHAPESEPPEESQPLSDYDVPRSRLGSLWAAAIGFALVLLLLLIFILENGQRADVAFFGVHGHLPLGVALLLAAVFGVLLVVIPGIGRMIQLRTAAKRHRRREAAGPPAQPAEPQPEDPDAPDIDTQPASPTRQASYSSDGRRPRGSRHRAG